ncbi:MAG: hypothetical protein HQL35_03590 [Alphaproteobacteria bacterium]|nr:hypothetical protein [Alphaproteobacteria bacterium]
MRDNLSPYSPHQIALSIGVLVVVVVKILLIWRYAPMAIGDNQGYIDAAAEILSSSAWLHDAGVDDSPYPPTLWRPIGYSLIVAAAKAVFADHWSVALGVLQSTLSLVTGLFLYRLCLRAKLHPYAALAVFVLYEWSAPMSTDVLIMEDALTGVLGMAALLALLFPIVDNRIPDVGRFAFAGCVTGLAFFLRDVYHFVMPILAVLTLIAVGRVRGWKAGASSAAVLIAPVLIASALLQGWNLHRAGAPVTATAGQSAYLFGMLRAARFDDTILSGDDVFLKTVRQHNTTYQYTDVGKITIALYEEHGMNSIAQLRAASTLFWRTLFTKPLPMIRAALHRVRPVQQGTLFAGPVTRIDDLDWWANAANAEKFYNQGWRAKAQKFRETLNPADLTPEVFLHLSLRTVLRAVGVALLAVFLIGAPWLWLKRRAELGGPAHFVMTTWGLYVLWVCMYIPVSFEVRYLSPFVGPVLVALAILVQHREAWLPARLNALFHFRFRRSSAG